MFKTTHNYSLVNAVLPAATANRIVDSTISQSGTSVLMWKARGTQLNDSWYQRWLPPISPARSMLQLLVPNNEVSRVVARVIDEGNLHRQATGAVYSTPCEHVYLGSQFSAWPVDETQTSDPVHQVNENLSVIHCVVGRQDSDRIARAAINSGSHGPIVHYAEGRGLRDRLGWLRITKEAEKDVLMVIADQHDVDDVFDAMAKAGQVHRPGRGFMYRLPINSGLFNLPSRVSHRHYDANMQQMIHAIDHLAGHKHWRDQSGIEVFGNAKSTGTGAVTQEQQGMRDQACISGIINRDNLHDLQELMLDAGAPGLNINHARFIADGPASQTNDASGMRVNHEYSLLRCVTDHDAAEQICASIDASAEDRGLKDLCMLVQQVPRVATYVPGRKDYRRAGSGGQPAHGLLAAANASAS